MMFEKLDLTTQSSWRLGRAGWPRWQTLAWPGMCTLMRPTGKEAQENVNCFQFFSFSDNLLLLIPSLLISPSVPSANKVDGPRVNEGLPLHIKVRCLGFRGESFHLPPSFSDNSDQSTSFFQSIFWTLFFHQVLMWELATLGSSPYPGVMPERYYPYYP